MLGPVSRENGRGNSTEISPRKVWEGLTPELADNSVRVRADVLRVTG